MGWLVKATHRSLYPPGKRHGTHGTGNWVDPRAVMDGRGRPRTTRIRSLHRSAHSESQLLSNLYNNNERGNITAYNLTLSHLRVAFLPPRLF